METKIQTTRPMPWRGISVELNSSNAKGSIIQSKLDYPIIQAPTSYIWKDKQRPMNELALVRDDNGVKLGLCTPRYKIVQNVDAFDFADVLVAENKAQYKFAGSMGDGELVWMLVYLPGDIELEKDVVEKYLCLTNWHDGETSLKIFLMPIRKSNYATYNISFPDLKNYIGVTHAGETNKKIKIAHKVVKYANEYFKRMETGLLELQDKKIERGESEKLVESLMFSEAELATPSVKKTNVLNNILTLASFKNDPTKANSVLTTLNAIYEYVDHEKQVRNLEEDPTNRLRSVWFGAGMHFKNKAWNLFTKGESDA